MIRRLAVAAFDDACNALAWAFTALIFRGVKQ
jgi:hypothetical protein